MPPMTDNLLARKTSRFRVLRAYKTTFHVLALYLFLFLVKRFLSEGRAEGLTAWTHHKASRLIITNILRLKGLYIKIGQTLSVMTNFLPKAFTDGLESLQDSVPPHPYKDVEMRFKLDFGKSPKDIFTSFEETPIASASLGQVHVAYLPDGTKLAVKLQYPHIDTTVKKDLKTIRRIFGLIDFLFPLYQFGNIYKECARIVIEELDFTSEGKNLEKIGANFAGNPKFFFPKVFWEHSSKKILTVEFVDGIKVTHVDTLIKAGINPHDVAVTLIHAYCKQIFIDGVYHADPHPGNVLIVPCAASPAVDEGGEPSPNFKVALIDFGATATVTPQLKEGIILFVEGLIKKDVKVLSTAMRRMGFVARDGNEEAIEKIVEYFYSKIRAIKIDDFRELKITDFQHLDDLFELKKIDISFKDLTSSFNVPKDWILLERALILTMGLVTHLDPQLNPADIVLPYAEEFVLGKDRKVTDMIVEGTKELLLSYINLPSELLKTLKKLEQGKITITDKTRAPETRRLSRSLKQLSTTLLLIFTSHMAYTLSRDGDIIWGTRLAYASGVFAFFLAVGWFRKS